MCIYFVATRNDGKRAAGIARCNGTPPISQVRERIVNRVTEMYPAVTEVKITGFGSKPADGVKYPELAER